MALLADARAAGLYLRLVEGKVRVTGTPEPTLLDRLRAHKGELAELLDGRHCRWCGQPVTDEHYRHPGGTLALPFADGSAAHVTCHAQAEVDRLLEAGRRAVAPVPPAVGETPDW